MWCHVSLFSSMTWTLSREEYRYTSPYETDLCSGDSFFTFVGAHIFWYFFGISLFIITLELILLLMLIWLNPLLCAQLVIFSWTKLLHHLLWMFLDSFFIFRGSSPFSEQFDNCDLQSTGIWIKLLVYFLYRFLSYVFILCPTHKTPEQSFFLHSYTILDSWVLFLRSYIQTYSKDY